MPGVGAASREVSTVGRVVAPWRPVGGRMAQVRVIRDLDEPNWLSERDGFAGLARIGDERMEDDGWLGREEIL